MNNKGLIDTNPQTRTRPTTVTAVYYRNVGGNSWLNHKRDFSLIKVIKGLEEEKMSRYLGPQ